MNGKTIDYYLNLNYPVAFVHTDDGYEVWHPDFGRAAVSGFEKTLNKAIKVLNEARAVFIEYLLEKGIEVPEPAADDEVFSGRFVVRVPKDLHARLAKEAHRNGVSLNSYIIHLLSEKSATERVTRRAGQLQEN